MDALQYEKRGYLLEPFRLFHLDSALKEDTDFHFHDFHKIVFFLDGRGNYFVEGRSYVLKPDDVVLVRQGTIHKASIDPTSRYERIILYISPEFLREKSTPITALDKCFEDAAREKSHVLRPASAQREMLMQMLLSLEHAVNTEGYGEDLSAEIGLMQILIELGRDRRITHFEHTVAQNRDDKALAILEYINDHITEQLNIDSLAERFFISKYYMMRKFRESTGYTIHGYVTEKRLYLARDLIRGGANVSEACFGCGYQDYSAFARAYKKHFGASPKKGGEGDARA